MVKIMKKRVKLINELIQLIASKKRGFFKGDSGIARFSINKGIVHFKEEHKGIKKPIKMGESWTKIGWCMHGSTISQQIINFSEFIWTGRPTQLCFYYSGFGLKDQIDVHSKAYNLGIIDHPHFHFHDYENHCDIKVSNMSGLNLRKDS